MKEGKPGPRPSSKIGRATIKSSWGGRALPEGEFPVRFKDPAKVKKAIMEKAFPPGRRPGAWEVILEKPVSVNHLFFSFIAYPEGVPFRKKEAFIRRIPTSEAKEFKAYAGVQFKGAGIPPFSGEFKVIWEVWGIYPSRHKRDLTNFEKAAKDAFKEAGLVPDDNIVLWREQDWWVEPGTFLLKIKIYESDLKVDRVEG